ncbi:MAG: tyrosine-type recombinase/integrase [Eggerthellales bacterium]|nr:tyrosine-type recombinase/integrase [Eggerthellales bacterium]
MCLTGLLGMRIGDVIDLRLGDIDWEANRIMKAQCKTKKALSLPLIDQVREPLLDYLDKGRPECDDDHVLIRAIAPYTGYASYSTFTKTITNHMIKAGVDIAGRHHGSHSLRHSTASSLLAKGATIEEVSEVLGHSSVDSTKVYLSLDAKTMRKLGLEVPHVER